MRDLAKRTQVQRKNIIYRIARQRRWPTLLSVYLLSCALAGTSVQANNLGENYSWRFSSSADRANKAVVLDIIEKKRAGMYQPAVTNNNNQIITNYNIEGSYIDCNLTSQATGNLSQPTMDVPIASPSIAVSADNSSSALGNTSTSDVQDNTTNTLSASSTDSISNTTTQSNDAASQDSTVSDNILTSDVSGLTSDGGSASASLNSTQTLTTSPTTATITESDACNFQQATFGTGSSINN